MPVFPGAPVVPSVALLLRLLVLLAVLGAAPAPVAAQTPADVPAAPPVEVPVEVPDEPAATPPDVPEYRVDRAPVVTASRAGVEPFALFGLHLERLPAEHLHVRFRVEGRWGPWLELPADHGPDAPTGEGQGGPAYVSEPIWVGEADGWEIDLPHRRLSSTGAVAILVRETGARSTVDSTADAAAATPAARASGAPVIRARSTWGAAPYRGTILEADALRMAVVHHSVTANAYTAAQVPSIIKGIQAYHQDGNGWDDIAYNFVVDRFGTVWEGRAGGIDRAIIGGHAKGFNTGSTGVVALGEFTAAVPSTATLDAIGRLLAWKLFHHGIDPDGRVEMRSYGNETYPDGAVVNLNRISGHRDTGATACPGSTLYDRLGVIRVGAIEGYDARVGAGTFTPRAVSVTGVYTPIDGDFDGDRRHDVLWYAPGPAGDYLWRGRADGGFTSTPVPVNGTYVPIAGDFTGDWADDILWYAPGPAPEFLWVSQRDGSFRTLPLTPVNGTYTPVVGEFSGDDALDIVWYRPGDAPDYFWQGSEAGAFRSLPLSVRGTYQPVVGDYDGDWIDDVLWYAPGAATDIVWLGKGPARFTPRSVSVSGTYQPRVGDFDGDGRDDVLWNGPGPATDWIWLATGNGRFGTVGIDQPLDHPPVTGDVTGGGLDDILWAGPSTGALWRSVGPGQFQQRGVAAAPATATAIPGDFNGDTRLDVLWYGRGAPADALWLADA